MDQPTEQTLIKQLEAARAGVYKATHIYSQYHAVQEYQRVVDLMAAHYGEQSPASMIDPILTEQYTIDCPDHINPTYAEVKAYYDKEVPSK